MQTEKTFYKRCTFYMLLALELLMAFTALGYIHVPPISIALAYIPILLTGVLCGVKESMLMGLAFGLTSLCKASVTYVLPADAVFSPFGSGRPMESLLLSVGTRTLYGLLIGLLYRCAAKSRHPMAWRIAVSLVATQLQALLVYGAMGLFFPELGFDFRSAIGIGFNEVALALLCVAVVEAVCAFDRGKAVEAYRQVVDKGGNRTPRNITAALVVLSMLMVGATMVATAYFANRASYMLGRHGIVVTDAMGHDLMNLQIQFLMAMLALCMMLVVTLVSVYRYTTYIGYQRELDSLTGVMGRRMFLRECGSVLEKDDCAGWFMILDVDHFKAINDTYGHPVGDKVLQRVAMHLEETFAEDGAAGRLGGDEFAAILRRPMEEAELREKLNLFLENVAGIIDGNAISCSIGVARFAGGQDMEKLMKRADRLLYQAKNAGRARYQIEG